MIPLEFPRILIRAFVIKIFIIGFIATGISQNADTLLKIDTTSFYSFQRSITGEFIKLQDQNDSVFAESLRKNWIEYQLLQDTLRVRVKPKVQPKIKERLKINDEFHDTIKGPEDIRINELLIDTIPEKNSIYLNRRNSSFEFYGEINDLAASPESPASAILDNSSVIDFYLHYCKDSILRIVSEQLLFIARELQLNDFGFFLLTLKVGRVLYKDIDEQILFSWVNLIRNGMDAKIGFINNKAYLLIACDRPIRNPGNVLISGVKYFLYQLPGQDVPGHLTISPYSRPGKSGPIRMDISEFPGFPYKQVIKKYSFGNDTVTVYLNRFLIDYLNNFIVIDLAYYFNSPVSDYALTSLDKSIMPLLQGKSEEQKINILLSFIQGSFQYKDDLDQFGHEKYMFGDEALYYPFIDCDDRSVLLAKLVKRYTHLDAVGLDYRDHVSVGVRFINPIKGDYIIYKNDRYYICDPTYIGARAGMAMDEMKTEKPVVIPVKM